MKTKNSIRGIAFENLLIGDRITAVQYGKGKHYRPFNMVVKYKGNGHSEFENTLGVKYSNGFEGYLFFTEKTRFQIY